MADQAAGQQAGQDEAILSQHQKEVLLDAADDIEDSKASKKMEKKAAKQVEAKLAEKLGKDNAKKAMKVWKKHAGSIFSMCFSSQPAQQEPSEQDDTAAEVEAETKA